MSEGNGYEEIREAVDEAKKPGVFKIVDALKDRAYPKMQVTVSVDEDAAYRANQVKGQINALDVSYAKKAMTEKVLAQKEALIASQELLVDEMAKSSFTFYLEGISEGARLATFKKSSKTYPIEYEKEMDITTGKMQKIEKESPERDALYTDLLWEACIRKVVNADGDEQTGVTYSDVRVMRDQMPVSASTKINDSIEKLRISTAVFMMEVDEDFLAKSSHGTTIE